MAGLRVLIHSDRLRSNLLAKQYAIEIDLEHLIAFNEELANRVRETPAEVLPLVSRFLLPSIRRISNAVR